MLWGVFIFSHSNSSFSFAPLPRGCWRVIILPMLTYLCISLVLFFSFVVLVDHGCFLEDLQKCYWLTVSTMTAAVRWPFQACFLIILFFFWWTLLLFTLSVFSHVRYDHELIAILSFFYFWLIVLHFPCNFLHSVNSCFHFQPFFFRHLNFVFTVLHVPTTEEDGTDCMFL